MKDSDINFRLLTYEIDVGIYVCDPQGTFIYANLALANIFGFEHAENIIGKNFQDFFSAERKHVFMSQFRNSMVSGTNATLIATEIIRRDQKTALIEVSNMPFIKNGALLGSQGVVHDVTTRRQTEKQMMYTSTHDPLTGIYNRNFFEEEMNRLERGRQFPISIIIIIAELGQHLNESEDQEDRDKLIKRVAHTLFYTFRGDDIVARIGEDVFAILIPRIDEDLVQEIVKRVQGDLLKFGSAESSPPLAFYFGAATANLEEKLTTALKQAEVIANLEKKKGK